MIRKFAAVLVTGLVFAACSHHESELKAIEEANDKETAEVIDPLPETVRNHVSLKRKFSDPLNDDEFVLDLMGKNYQNADVVFCILNPKHDTIFLRHAKGKNFLTADERQNLNKETQTEYIQQRMSTFFAQTGFSSPPYTLNDPTKNEFAGDLELWNEIRNDTTIWCFEFILENSGETEVIAYSRAKDTVLVYDSKP